MPEMPFLRTSVLKDSVGEDRLRLPTGVPQGIPLGSLYLTPPSLNSVLTPALQKGMGDMRPNVQQLRL